MRLAALLGISVLSLLIPAIPAFAQADCKQVVAPSPFGPDDRNRRHQSRDTRRDQGRRGRNPDRRESPNGQQAGRRRAAVRHAVHQDDADSLALVPGAEYGKNKLTYMEDTYLSQSHVGTHIDGMGHIGIQDCYYNQTPMGKYVTQNYLKRLGSRI